MYYKLYREPVSPTVLTPWCGDQEKTSVPGIEVVHEEARTFFIFTFHFCKHWRLLQREALIQSNQCINQMNDSKHTAQQM